MPVGSHTVPNFFFYCITTDPIQPLAVGLDHKPLPMLVDAGWVRAYAVNCL